MSTLARTILTIAVACSLAIAASPAAAGGAKVSGTVKLDGSAPTAKTMTITKDNAVCGDGERAVDTVTVTEAGLLADVVVFVDGEIEGVEVPTESFRLVQKGCRFQPYVSFVPKKGSLEIVNDDPVAHNIHAYELIGRARRDLMNIAQPNPGQTDTKTISPRRGNVIQLTCDIHDFMKGWIFVPDNPFAAVAGDGTFALEGIPAGKRTLKAFHPVLGFQETELDLSDGGAANVEFVFKADK